MPATGSLSECVTSLHRNPFHVLGATTRDGRSRIVELAEDRSLIESEEACRDAQNALINLRGRLSAEMAWFPGVSPRKAAEVVDGTSALSIITAKGELPPLARANALSSMLEVPTAHEEPAKLATLLLKLSEAVEETDLPGVLRDINEDRSVAGYQPVRDLDLVVAEFEVRKRAYRNSVRDIVDRLPSKVIVKLIDYLVVKSTDGGKLHVPAVVQDLVDVYEIGSRTFAERETENIAALVNRARAAFPHGEDAVLKVYEDIERAAVNFNVVMKPIQVVSEANGIDHSPSANVAIMIRSLAIDAFNDRDFYILPVRITDFLLQNFPRIGEVKDQVAVDAEHLKAAAERKRKAEEDKAQFDRELEYSAKIGVLFTDRVAISSAAFEWQNNRYALDAITRLRWGGTRHSVNGIPTGTSRMIVVGDAASTCVVNLRNETVYDNLVQRLWRSVGFRLLVGYVQTLRDGGRLTFPNCIVRDDGVTLSRRGWMGKKEVEVLGWNDVNVWSSNGNFCIGKKADPKFHAAMSYQKDDNTVVIENLIRGFFKSDKQRPSQILD